jgi:5-methylcytosine-specific restriction endonuclease McrA
LMCDRCGAKSSGRLCRQCYRHSVAGRQPWTVECKVCGKSIVKRSDRYGDTCDRFCGTKLAARMKLRARQNREASAALGRLFPCEVCGFHFLRKPGSSKTWCNNQECRNKHRAGYWLATYYGSGGYQAKKCVDCGDPAEIAKKRKSRFCAACRQARKKASLKQGEYTRRRRQSGVTSTNSKGNTAKIAEMIRNAGNQCPLCGLLMTKGCQPNTPRHAEIDHLRPLSRGGEDDWHNLRIICMKCNNMKRDMYAPEVILMPRAEAVACG